MGYISSRTTIESTKRAEVNNTQSHQKAMNKFRLEKEKNGDRVVGVVRYSDNFGFNLKGRLTD